MDRDSVDFDLGQAILTAYDADGFLGIGVDVPGGDQSGTSTFEARFPYGTFGRPQDPTVSPDGGTRVGATTLYGYNGPQRNAWPCDDPRVTPKLPQASKGTWGAFADTLRDDLPVMVLDGTTGSFALRVPHSVGNVSSRILVDVETPGGEEIRLAHGGGCELAIKALETIIGDDGLALALAKATAVQSLVTALQTFAGALGTATNIAQVAAAGTALQGSLAALPVIPTTKLRSE
jgi:hypothetical protein